MENLFSDNLVLLRGLEHPYAVVSPYAREAYGIMKKALGF